MKNLKRFLSLTVILALIAPVMINAQAGKVSFAGSWVTNAEKSTPAPQGGGGGGARMGGGNFDAAQEANLLTVTRTRTGQDGTPTTTKMLYTLDGKESVNTNPRGESKSVAKWSADGKTLTIVTTSTFGDRTMTSTEAWTLTDPKTITITATRKDQDGNDVVTKRVYDKK
jgi:dipeptidyl aminopeptidase/acylaminoacyl peptidase